MPHVYFSHKSCIYVFCGVHFLLNAITKINKELHYLNYASHIMQLFITNLYLRKTPVSYCLLIIMLMFPQFLIIVHYENKWQTAPVKAKSLFLRTVCRDTNIFKPL